MDGLLQFSGSYSVSTMARRLYGYGSVCVAATRQTQDAEQARNGVELAQGETMVFLTLLISGIVGIVILVDILTGNDE